MATTKDFAACFLEEYQLATTPISENSQQNIYELASRKRRLGAFTLHNVLAIVWLYAAASLWFFYEEELMFSILTDPYATPVDVPIAFAIFMLSNNIARLWVLVAFYYWGINILLLKTSGETICKKIFGVKIITKNYEKAPLMRVLFCRYFLFHVPIPMFEFFVHLWGFTFETYAYLIFYCLFYLVTYALIFRKSRRTLQDLLAGTIVIKAKA